MYESCNVRYMSVEWMMGGMMFNVCMIVTRRKRGDQEVKKPKKDERSGVV